MEEVSELIDLVAELSQEPDKKIAIEDMGDKIGRLYTDHGFPIDMSFDRLPHECEKYKPYILFCAQQQMLEHKRMSGATEKAIEQTRTNNRKIMQQFIKTGEVGIY
jgi:hypothetical protein